MTQPAKFRVVLDHDGIIRVVIVGNITEQVATQVMHEADVLADQLRTHDKKILILVDQSQVTGNDAGARALGRKVLEGAKYDRLALYGENTQTTPIVKYLLNTISGVARVKLFKKELPALRWLHRARTPLRRRARRMFVAGSLLAVLALLWHQVVAPYRTRLPGNFSYEANVISHDNFYDEQTAGFTGETSSDTKFAYEVVGARGDVVDIRNSFDVRSAGGEQIFAVTRTYGINRYSGQHVAKHGDRDRSGYLFAPRNLAKQDFTYWHINYDAPAHMKYQAEEEVLGLKTYRYAATYQADQTKELGNLPGVGETRGINLDISLQLWVEPQTGYLIKYEDSTTAYYYDLKSGQRTNPWNRFDNSYSFESIAAQVQHGERLKTRKSFAETGFPIFLTVLAVLLFLRGCVLLARSRAGGSGASTLPLLVSWVVAGGGATVLLGWLTENSLLKSLHPSFSAMHVLTASNFMLAAGALALSVKQPLTARRRLIVRALLSVMMLFSGLAFARAAFGLDSGLDAVLVALGFTSADNVSPFTAVCFVVVGLALWRMDVRNQKVQAVLQVLLSTAFTVPCLVLAGYVFSVDFLYSLSRFRTMALHTAVLFLVLTVGVFAVHKDWLITKVIKSFSRSLMIALLVFGLLLTLTGLIWQQVVTSANKQAGIQFQSDATDLHDTITNELSGYVKTLRGTKALFAASQEVSRTEWKAYIDGLRLAQNYPGMQGIGFIRLVSPAERAAHIAGVRAEGFPDYTIHPDGSGGVTAPVVFIEPFDERNQRAFGFDMLSESIRRGALERTRDTGEPALSAKVTLIQETNVDRQAGLLFFLPIYQQGASLTTLQQRREAVFGYVYTPLRMSNFMDTTLGEDTSGVNIEVYDASSADTMSAANLLFAFSDEHDLSQPEYQPEFVRTLPLQAGGRTLTVRYTSLPTYVSGAQTLPTLVLVGGLALSFLLSALTFLLSSSRNRALKLAERMTLDLRAERNQAIINQRKDEAILSSIGDGVFVLNPAGNITLFNTAAELLSGYAAQEAVGHPYHETLNFYSEKTGQTADDFIQTALSGKGAEMPDNTLLKRKDGTHLPVADSAAPIINAAGGVDGAVVVFRDITKEKQVEHMKDEFLSIASHELRTPMGAIRANISMILAGDYGPVNKELVEPLSDMKESTVRLVELVSDLLNVARIEAGRMKFVLNDFDIHTEIKATVASLAPLGKEKGVTVSLTEGPSAVVQADPDKLKQVLTNLIGNSLKFTDKGSISVAIAPQGDKVEVAVTDTGVGIAEADKAKLFGKFEQITSAQAGKPAGTGLGLYISREIIRKQGGDLWIKQTAPGQGSTFAFTIPMSGSLNAKRVKDQIANEAALHPDQK